MTTVSPTYTTRGDITRLDTIGPLRRQQAEGLEGEDLEHSRDLIRAESSKAAHRAWHAGIAVGPWPDRDLAPDELEWLRNETAALDPEQQREADPKAVQVLTLGGAHATVRRLAIDLPPMPLRDIRESVHGERRAVTIGVSAPVARVVLSRAEFLNVASLRHVAHLLDLSPVVDAGTRRERAALLKGLRQAGIQFSRRPDGTVIGFAMTGETILRTDREWIITDADTAEEMFEDWKERLSSDAPRLDNLSDNPTNPSMSPTGSYLCRSVRGTATVMTKSDVHNDKIRLPERGQESVSEGRWGATVGIQAIRPRCVRTSQSPKPS